MPSSEEIKACFPNYTIDIYDPREKPFSVHGLIFPDTEYDCYHRVPEKVVSVMSEMGRKRSKNAAGGRIRFATDADRMFLYVRHGETLLSSIMAYSNSAGLDLYEDASDNEHHFLRAFTPSPGNAGKEAAFTDTAKLHPEDGEMKEYTLNLPSYGTVEEIYIGFTKGAKVLPHTPYRLKKPVVFYGSSITQGAAASRPGCIYQNRISRRFDTDYINLGFSGSALAEPEMADFISSLDMSVFVMDYDHNAPDPEYLEKTHYPFFAAVRKKHPRLPVICVSMPNDVKYNSLCEDERQRIIMNTIEKARGTGDTLVEFVRGRDIYKFSPDDSFTVDYAHPNDVGMYYLAGIIGDKLKKYLV